jgi:hypothetical protein
MSSVANAVGSNYNGDMLGQKCPDQFLHLRELYVTSVLEHDATLSKRADRKRQLAFSAATDLYLAIYPKIVLAKLRIGRLKKFMLSLALGLGFV